MTRTAHIERVIKETKIVLDLDLDGINQIDVVDGFSFRLQIRPATGRTRIHLVQLPSRKNEQEGA